MSEAVAPGTLSVVGTGYLVAGQVTAETRAVIADAERCLYLVSDPATAHWIRSLNPRAESLKGCYAVGKPREESYREMVERMLGPLRQGLEVCAVFYGHPGVFVQPSHDAIRQARAEGFAARMLPAVSAEDCLFADLGIDPAVNGWQSFEASDFLIRRRLWDPTADLILWQIGAIGVGTYLAEGEYGREGLAVLAEVLQHGYPAGHRVTVYEASPFPMHEPRIEAVALASLAATRVSVVSTLFVPPATTPELDRAMLEKLGLPQPGSLRDQARPGA